MEEYVQRTLVGPVPPMAIRDRPVRRAPGAAWLLSAGVPTVLGLRPDDVVRRDTAEPGRPAPGTTDRDDASATCCSAPEPSAVSPTGVR
jgi:hypothetical protein